MSTSGELRALIDLEKLNAANNGVLTAKREFAIMYMDGMGCEENKTKAFCLFKETSEQDKMAYCIISDWYYEALEQKQIWSKEYPNVIR
ncbi:21446_t:CDS:2 [Gigaspora rosea]|nr:21446_t:CDS:2 [Gigaspora rosea]